MPVAGLTPDTRYYYSVGSAPVPFVGDDADHFFLTPPTPGTPKPTASGSIGDAGFVGRGRCDAVRDAFTRVQRRARRTDLWLLLGDNAYIVGTRRASTRRPCSTMHPTMLRTGAGLADVRQPRARSRADSITQTGPYFDMFTLPDGGEAGGVPSGTEAYYSFDYANMHFVVLDSEDSSHAAGEPDADLARVGPRRRPTADWVIAFWHQPALQRGPSTTPTPR